MKKIIINADDFGLSNKVNRAIDSCFKNSIISSTTLLVNFPAYDEAVELAFQSSYVKSIGLHFNIVEGSPLSTKMKMSKTFCKNGYFVYKRNQSLFFSYKDIMALRDECELQIRRMLSSGITPSHMDSHTHVHTEISIFLAIAPILKKYNIKNIRRPLNTDIRYNLKWLYKCIYTLIVSLWGFKTTKVFTSYFNDKVDDIACESIELMVHPILEEGVLCDSVTKKVIVKKSFTSAQVEIINYKSL